jgi:hypothetical protein
MTRKSPYRFGRIDLSALRQLQGLLTKTYSELQDLREQVRRAEAEAEVAAAERLIRLRSKAQRKVTNDRRRRRLARAAKSEDKKRS